MISQNFLTVLYQLVTKDAFTWQCHYIFRIFLVPLSIDNVTSLERMRSNYKNKQNKLKNG
jgi:hypothetical protein